MPRSNTTSLSSVSCALRIAFTLTWRRCCPTAPTPKKSSSRLACCCGKRGSSLTPTPNFVAWACGMVHHEVRNFLRKHRDRGRVYLSEDVLAEVGHVRLELHDVLES